MRRETDMIVLDRNQICAKGDAPHKIRSIILDHSVMLPDHAFHITSDLNWLRYLKQAEFLKKIISPRSKVLDLGCGLGFTTALLASYCEAIDILGVDIKKHSTWKDLKEFGCDFCVCDANSLPFLPDSFEVIVSFGVMEHTESEMEFLEEVNRCLQSGGYNILFQLPNRYSFSEYLSRKMGLWHHERTYSGGEIRKQIKNGGFDIMFMAREHVIPAQVHRVSRGLGDIFDKNHRGINNLDALLCKTPLSIFSQDYMLISKKHPALP